MLGQMFTDDAEFECTVFGGKFMGDAHEIGIAGVSVGGSHVRHPDPVAPFDFERRRGEIKRPRKVTLAADAGFGDRLFGRQHGHALGQLRRRHRVPVHIIDGAGDGGAQSLGREARNSRYAGHAARQFCPIFRLADAKRGDHADAGDGNDRTPVLVAAWRCHEMLPQPTRSTSARPSPRQLPTDVTIT